MGGCGGELQKQLHFAAAVHLRNEKYEFEFHCVYCEPAIFIIRLQLC